MVIIVSIFFELLVILNRSDTGQSTDFGRIEIIIVLIDY